MAVDSYIKIYKINTIMMVLFVNLNALQDDLRGKLIDPPAEGAQDTDTRVLDAYIQQCTAEAQESKHTKSPVYAFVQEKKKSGT